MLNGKHYDNSCFIIITEAELLNTLDPLTREQCDYIINDKDTVEQPFRRLFPQLTEGKTIFDAKTERLYKYM